MVSALAIVAAVAGAPGCLVLNLHPAYAENDRSSIVWEPSLVGEWRNADGAQPAAGPMFGASAVFMRAAKL